MIRNLFTASRKRNAFSRWLLSRRFNRYFVRPFAAEIEKARSAHVRNEALKAQRERLHAALAGAKR